MSNIDIVVIILYFAVLVGVVAYNRVAKSLDEFAVGSRQIPGFIVLATLSATYIGPGYSMGLANNAAGEGIIWLLVFMAFSMQTVLIGIWIAPRLRRFEGAFTVGDVMGYRYGKAVQLLTGVLSVALTAGFVGVITRASGEIIHAFTGLPVLGGIIISIAVVIAYASLGGIKSVIVIDVFQFIVLAISIPLVIVFMASHTGGLEAIVERVPHDAFTFGGHFPPIVLFGLFVAFFLGETLIPPYANRALVARDSANARYGFVLAGLFSIAWFAVCVFIGMLGNAFLEDPGQNVFLSTIQAALPVGLFGLACTAMISIIMSSQSSLLNAASVAFNNDILALLSPRMACGHSGLIANRLLTVVIGVAATLFALTVPGLVDALLYCYTLWAPTVVLPLVIAVLFRGAHPYAGLGAILAGGIATAIWEWGLGTPGEIPSLLVGVVANQLVFWTLQAALKRPPTHHWLVPAKENFK